ncbi:MAG: NAD(P)H-binding protein [Erythrobacter sp.]|uniref:NAD(P)H-binding protein n=1 Tax=Erythrobacter sp. Alg231-14 TaxID=1922225 RepID=UPI000D54FDF1
MSDAHKEKTPVRLGLVGATGLIGRRLITLSSAGEEARIVGIARREVDLPKGARVEMFVAEPEKWGEVMEAVRPQALICALGTTWKKAGRDEAAFRAVDHDLVVSTAIAAKQSGITNMVLVTAAGADAQSKSLYMRVKGEVERAVSNVGFKRLDILRPGLLKGPRQNDLRPIEAIAQVVSPLVDPLIPAKWDMYRSVDADLVAEAILGLALRKAAGRFTHDNEAMKRAAREWRTKAGPAPE